MRETQGRSFWYTIDRSDKLNDYLRQWFPTKAKDTTLLPISDTHVGGTTALFPHFNELPLGGWQFQHNRVTPSEKQNELALHWDYCADWVLQNRKERLIIVLNGDLIDGVHHNSLQLTTHVPHEQAEVFIWLMNRFLKRSGFSKNKGDLLYIVTGTESHTGDIEYKIGEEIGAEPHDHLGAYDFLPLEINGKLFWFLHQGANVGKGPNKGDSIRNWLKAKYWELLEEKERIPDFVISSHYHQPFYNSYERPTMTMHGMVTGSFQLKTRFGIKVAAAEREHIGMWPIEISGEGEIRKRDFLKMSMRDEVVKV